MDYAGRQFAHPSENIIFRNCHFVQNAMAIGSEESGGVRNVTFENIVMGPRHAPYTEGPLIHLKAQRGRGGYIKDVHFKNITMLGETNQAILVSMHYSNHVGPTNKTGTPVFSNIFFEDVDIAAAVSPGGFVGLPESLITNIQMKNVKVRETKLSWQCEDVDKASSAAINVSPSVPCF
jgi:polygalacturonase